MTGEDDRQVGRDKVIEVLSPRAARLAVVEWDDGLREFPPDVVRLLDVLARIELRRQACVRELREREAS